MAEIQHLVQEELLRTTPFDRVSAGLTTANLILGLFVIAMFLTWLSRDEKRLNATVPPVAIMPTPAMVDDEIETDLTLVTEAIFDDELPELNRMDSALALQQLSQAISRVRASVGHHLGLGEENGRPGIRRKKNIPSDGGRAKHWQIQFDELSQEEYYRMLEQFEAKLFVVRKSTNEIVIVPCQDNPLATNSSRRELNNTFYFVHETSRLQMWDRQLATKAKVNVDDSFFAINFPPHLLAKLAELERLKVDAKGQTLTAVRRSIFKVHRTKTGFDFALDSQVFTRIH